MKLNQLSLNAAGIGRIGMNRIGPSSRGSLHPGMVRFRPVVDSDIPYKEILYFMVSTGAALKSGDYIPIGGKVQMNISTVYPTDEVTKVTVNGKEAVKGTVDDYYRFTFDVDKSPQRITITIYSPSLSLIKTSTIIRTSTILKI